MKPMSPEQKEIDELGAEVSAAYRSGADAEPPARVDASILDAARREAGRPRRRAWQVPAAVAAVLVLGVSLTLRMRDDFGGLPPPEPVGRKPAELAKPAAPNLDMQSSGPQALREEKQAADTPARPSRERPSRVGREAGARTNPEAAASRSAESEQEPASPSYDPSVASLPVPPPAPQAYSQGGQASVAAPEDARSADAESDATANKSEVAGAVQQRRSLALRKEAPAPAGAAVARSAEDWMREIEILLRDGRTEEARTQFSEFRRRYPDQAVSEGLKAFARDFEAGK